MFCCPHIHACSISFSLSASEADDTEAPLQEIKQDVLNQDISIKLENEACDIENLEKALTQSDDALDLCDPVFNSDMVSVFEKPENLVSNIEELVESESPVRDTDALQAKDLLSKLRKLYDQVSDQLPGFRSQQEDEVSNALVYVKVVIP